MPHRKIKDVPHVHVVRIDPLVGHSLHFNASQVCYKGPCLVTGITISADGVNGDCQIYDGENANCEFKYHLEALAGTTFSADIWEATDFNHGIFLVVNAATTHVTIQYIPLPLSDFY